MSINPFDEPDDGDRTVIRPVPGGRRAVPPARAAQTTDATQAIPRQPAAAPNQGRERAVLVDGGDAAGIGITPLTAAAAPLLQLLARLRNTASQPDAGDLRERAVGEMRGFEQRARGAGIPMEQLRPAHYALCASLDDVVLATPWGSSGGWESRSLVATFHQEVRSGKRFFDLLRQMNDNPGRFLPVSELMYLCMSLGFIGQYRTPPFRPADIEKVREETYALIMRHRQPGNPELSPHWKGVAAPYRPARARLPIWVAAAAGLALLAGLFAWLTTGLNTASEDVLARLNRAPPTAMPEITRVETVQAPLPPAPPPPVPTSVDRLRTFLEPEIREGLVEVLGTANAPIIRLSGNGMFEPASATLRPNYVRTLERIGAALRDEPGKVRVIGHTDSQPINTRQFPNNQKLSTSRAESAMAVINSKIDDTSRVSAEGRADSQPLVPNTTAENLARNRRVEVILFREG